MLGQTRIAARDFLSLTTLEGSPGLPYNGGYGNRKSRIRDLALFNLAIDSKLRVCDLVQLRVCDVAQGIHIASRTIVMQRKTQRPVQFRSRSRQKPTVEAGG